MTDYLVGAEVSVTEFEFGDDDTIVIKQVKVHVFGYDFYLDPDQATLLTEDIAAALTEIEGK